MLTDNEKLKSINKVPFWWHTINFGGGVISKGHKPLKGQEVMISSLPKDLKAKSVLDIGCWDGVYSFECENRGAKVTAIENKQCERFVKSSYHKKIDCTQGFKVAKKILNSKVKFKLIDLYNLEKSTKKYDLVLCFGVIYHLKYPYKALEIIYNLTKELLILESYYIKTMGNKPLMVFYPSDELNKDPTNWWGPNIPCLTRMLESVGFKKVKVYKKDFDENKNNEDNRVIIKAYK